jgi:Eco57I restriction-modification methylase
METAPLKPFATWARTALIREVAARIAVVLAPASPERVEQPGAVAAVEKAIRAAGGGDAGRAAVADKVAYTWFNRIIALRFMDANGYTGIGVVSPERGREGGQPEVLAEAKRGNIDSAVIANQRTVDTVTSLLNGIRRSEDPQGEAYALLLAEYCRYWNRSMPFMFEREGDYTELLIPANLLADDSVLARAVTVLTDQVCQDVEVIGWLYQFYISERYDEVFAGFKKGIKADAAVIPAATQLFTPHWIVRYLVENSLGRLWLLNRPNSRLAELMEYYIAPVDEETDYLKVTSPDELKIIDPACGSGHMLTYAFDLLYAIYEEEGYAPSDIPGLIVAKNLYGTEIDARAGALAAFALTMKARSYQRTFLNKQIQPNICVLEPISFTPSELDALVTADDDRADQEAFWNQFQQADVLGSLIKPILEPVSTLKTLAQDLFTQELFFRQQQVIRQADYLSREYTIVVANPPYMGSRNMPVTLSAYLKDNYSSARQDLYGCFVVRGMELAQRNGLVGVVTGDSWMTIKSFEDFRINLLDNHYLASFLHLDDVSKHADIFGANAAFVVSNDSQIGSLTTFIRLSALSSEEKRRQLLSAIRTEDSQFKFKIDPHEFKTVPGAPIAYQLSDTLRRAFVRGKPLAEIGEPRQGLATADNARFVRLWHEVSVDRVGLGLSRDDAIASRLKWFPYNKGGQYRKWYGNQEFVVNWHNDGAEIRSFGIETGRPRSRAQNTAYYFLPCISWSKIGSGMPSFRYFPDGFIFDVAGTSVFASELDRLRLAAVCNSKVARVMLAATSPTLNFEVGTLAQLPDGALKVVRELIGLHKEDWNIRETSWSFESLELIGQGGTQLGASIDDVLDRGIASARRAQELEESLNVEIAAAYGVELEVESAVPLSEVTLHGNPVARFGPGLSSVDYHMLYAQERVNDLVSYAVGCMLGRYSLDEPGLILANQGDTLEDYLGRIPNPSFMPDEDNVIPIVEGDWFEDDIVGRFRQFLRVAFGEQYLQENLRFVTEVLGVKDLRDYFVKSFYKDHVQRYKKRPIYWLFSSPKGSFNALIYMHRYTPSAASTVLNEYLREFRAKLEASRQHHERLVAGTGTPREKAGAQKEADRLRKVLLELDEYEHDVLYPLATQQVQIDLDDGVKVNYPKFGAALKQIPSLEASDE